MGMSFLRGGSLHPAQEAEKQQRPRTTPPGLSLVSFFQPSSHPPAPLPKVQRPQDGSTTEITLPCEMC